MCQKLIMNYVSQLPIRSSSITTTTTTTNNAMVLSINQTKRIRDILNFHVNVSIHEYA